MCGSSPVRANSGRSAAVEPDAEQEREQPGGKERPFDVDDRGATAQRERQQESDRRRRPGAHDSAIRVVCYHGPVLSS